VTLTNTPATAQALFAVTRAVACGGSLQEVEDLLARVVRNELGRDDADVAALLLRAMFAQRAIDVRLGTEGDT
jgi:hypothetical protein